MTRFALIRTSTAATATLVFATAAALAAPTSAGSTTAGSTSAGSTSAGAGTSSVTASSTQRLYIGGWAETDLALGMTIGEGKASLYPSYTGPTGLAGTVTDVDVRIENFSHERPRDVDIMLEAPNGQTVMLMSDVGGTTPVTGLDLTFDDAALAEVNPAGVPQSGTWRPSNEDADDVFPAPAPATVPAASLAALNGQRPGGAWAVYVVDDTFDYFGSIEGFWLDIETTGPSAYPSTVQVSGAPDIVTDLDVTLTGLRHIWATDLDVLLVGPGGQQATILSDGGIFEVNVNSVDLTFDDEATDPLPDRIVSGRFRPLNRFGADEFPAPAPTASGESDLSVFDGTNPNGTWRLYVVDDREKDDGTLEGWSLQITAKHGPRDKVHPRVTSKFPGGGVTGVGRQANVVAVVDEKLRSSTIARWTAYVVPRGSTRRVPALVTWDPVRLRIVIDPHQSLRARTTYRVVVTSQVTDLAGNRLDQDRSVAGAQAATWRFTTR